MGPASIFITGCTVSDPRILTDWEAHLTDSDAFLNLYVEFEDCPCARASVCVNRTTPTERGRTALRALVAGKLAR